MSTRWPELDATRLERELGSRLEVHVRDRVDSTNDEVRRIAAADRRALLVVAGSQRAGRGRLGRHWHSPAGGGVYLSLLVRPSTPAGDLARWTIGAGVAVCRGLATCGARDVALEWPNDLTIAGRKLGGVLVEGRTQGNAVTDLVIGVGINLATPGAEADDEIRGRAVGLADALHPAATPDRERVAIAVTTALLETVARLERGGWPTIVADWLARSLDAPGRRVEVRGDGGWRRGVTRGLDDDGALLVRHDDGREVAVRLAGSVRHLEV